MYFKKERDFDFTKLELHDPNYTSLVSVKCKCGHTVSIYNRYKREICTWCGRLVFLTKKDEFYYNLKRKGVI